MPATHLLTVSQVVEITGLSAGTVYNLAYRRTLPTVKLGRALRFRASDIEKYIADGSRPALSPTPGQARTEMP